MPLTAKMALLKAILLQVNKIMKGIEGEVVTQMGIMKAMETEIMERMEIIKGVEMEIMQMGMGIMKGMAAVGTAVEGGISII